MENLGLAAKAVLSNYVTFSGRSSRAEFWWWVLVLLIAHGVTAILDAFVAVPFLGPSIASEDPSQPFSFVLGLCVTLPNIALGTRRLRDIGRSGWWLLIVFIPIAGLLVLIYFFAQPGNEGPNSYGEAPAWPPKTSN